MSKGKGVMMMSKTQTYGGINNATAKIETQKKSGLAMNGFDTICATGDVGGGSWLCRDGDHTERIREGIDGIRFPVTEI